MKQITTRQQLTVAVERGRRTITLRPDVPYIMHDVEVVSGARHGAFATIDDVPDNPIDFNQIHNKSTSILLPFIGGLGDAIAMLPLLHAIKQQMPGASIDVATTPGPAEVFAHVPNVRHVHEYPLTRAAWSSYDMTLNMESVVATPSSGQDLTTIFAAATGITLQGFRYDLDLPEPETAPEQDDGPALVGLVVGEGQTGRDMPHRHTLELMRRLVQQNIAFVTIGHADDTRQIPQCPPAITDLRGQTPSIRDLAGVLTQLDLLVTHDTYPMHLAGALNVPTLATFANTSPSLADPYQSVRAIGIGCCDEHCVRIPSSDLGEQGIADPWNHRLLSCENIEQAVLMQLARATGARDRRAAA